MPKFQHASIRLTLLIVISILNVLIASLSGAGVLRAWDSYRDAQELERNSAVVNLLYHAEKNLSLERGASLPLLYVSSDTAVPLNDSIKEARDGADANLKRSLMLIQEELPSGVAKELGRVNIAYASLQAGRKALDQALGQAPAARDLTVATQLRDDSTGLIENVRNLIQAYSRPMLAINPTVTQQMLFKYFIWEITEYAGQEYAIIGKLIVENKRPTQEQQETLIFLRGQVEKDWDLVHQFALSSGLSDKLGPQLDEAQTHYFMTYDQIKDMFYAPQALSAKSHYPLSIELWLGMASQAVDSLLDLKDASLLETQNYIDGMAKEARQNIIVSLCLFWLGLALSFYSWHTIRNRVIRPVNTMVDALYREAHDALPAAERIVPGGDEISKLARVLGAFQDSTRKIARTSKSLEQQKNYLKTVLETILDAIIAFDEEGHIQMVNPAAEQLFGFTWEEMIDRNIKMLIPDAYAAATDGIGHYLQTGEGNIIGGGREVRALRKNGSSFPAELAITEMKDVENHIFVATLHDITDRKKAEEERVLYMRNLEDSNRELDDFAYIASHDLKEPLRGMHNFSKFLLEDYSDKLGAEGKDMLNTIGSLTQRMDRLLSSLLHYSRLGRTDLSIQNTDLNDLLNDALDMFAIKIKELHVSIIVPRPLPEIVCDHVRVAEVFQNLIGNALKYNDSAEKKIEIGYRDDHPAAQGERVYYVKDNGIGIEERNLGHIFKIFRRLHAQEAYGGGTGSGLTIAKKIIARHSGRMWAESPGKGQGSTFCFTIPQGSRQAPLHSGNQPAA